MRIIGGDTISVYRFDRDRFGDKVNETHVGDISHCVFQWANASSVGLRFHPNDNYQETAEVSAVIFIPRDATVKVQPRDRIKLNGHTYQVVGDRAWDELHPATGYNFGYCMIQVEMAQ